MVEKEEQEQEQLPEFDVEVTLPTILQGPFVLSNGDTLDIGDMVEHPELGIGRIYRIVTYYNELGTLVCIDFPQNVKEMIRAESKFLKKIQI